MRNPKPLNSTPSSGLSVFDGVLLVIVLCLTALRSTYIENPHVEQMQTPFFLSSELVSLLISTMLLGCFALWLTVRLLTNRFTWRRTRLGYAVGGFLLAGGLAFLAASHKRAALTDLAVLAAPMLSALLLVQLFTSARKIQLAVLLVMAVGVMMSAQCMEQYADSNEAVIRDYERDPVAQLENLNIEPDSLEHWMYEHRLYSQDIRGFLLTSNSAASFFLLAGFAGLGLCLQAFRRIAQPESLTALVGYALVLIFILIGLFLTQSKGGLGAFVLGVVLLGILSRWGERLWKHRRLIGFLLLGGLAAGIAVVVAYGTAHERLPGGNSMLVRWQYWQSTARMIADHVLTGVGGGNFRFQYPQYKIAAASETIQDPHNFVLSLLSQYGPLGLAAFLAAVLRPVYTSFKFRFEPLAVPPLKPEPDWKLRLLRPAAGVLLLFLFLLLIIRPLLVDMSFFYQEAGVRAAAYVVLYLFWAFVFVLTFGLLGAATLSDTSLQAPKRDLSLALVCGLAAVLVHNLVDFALFEVGVWNLFWLLIAIPAACRHQDTPAEEAAAAVTGGKRLAVSVGLAAAVIGWFCLVLAPPLKANRLYRQSLTARTPRIDLLEQAVAADPLSPDTAYNSAALLMQLSAAQRSLDRDASLLEQAAAFADIAHRRNPDSFKPFRLKADILLRLAERAGDADRADYYERAYQALSEAEARYPGSDRIHFQLGQVAEQLDHPRAALAHYQQAVAIEQAYQAQFQVMYPDRRPVISRLGNTAYTIAQAKIEELQKQLQQAESNPSSPD